MATALLIALSPGELWAARVEAGSLTDLRVERLLAPSRVGEIRLGRVAALMPELPAAHVDIGDERPAFLSAEDARPGRGLAGLTEGQAVLVQIRRDARAGKAVGVTLRPRLEGQLLALTPARPGIAAAPSLDAAERQRLVAALAAIAQPGEGLALLPAAAGAAPEALAGEAALLRRRWAAIEAARQGARPPALLEAAPGALAGLLMAFAGTAERIVIDDRAGFAEARAFLLREAPALAPRLALHREREPLFEHQGIAGEVAAALAPRVPLAGGGALAIETPAAATFIDVDSGTLAGRRSPEMALRELNLAAAAEAARQIRLRNLAGAIVIDFVSLRRRDHRAEVLSALAAALARDPVPSEVLGWTRLGHVELTRKRARPSLSELLCEPRPGGALVRTPLTMALAALKVLLREADAAPGRRLALRLHPLAAEALAGEAAPARLAAEARLGREIRVDPDPGLDREQFEIRPWAGDPSAPIMKAMTSEPAAPARPCPICGKPASPRHRPFCSPRCATIDLGRWLKGGYSIPTEETPEEAPEGGGGEG